VTDRLRLELFVADVDRSVRYYRDVLGFVADVTGDDGYVAVRRGDAVIGLGRADRLPDDHPVALVGGRPPGRGVEVVVEVDDVEATYRRAAGAGAAFASGLEPRPWGATDFRVLDPDGYYLRVTGR
jgi:lactoylglutathione lyase